jgi:glycosyltransferase involved in cell wall biosynthesis
LARNGPIGRVKVEHDRVLTARYPYYDEAVCYPYADAHSPLTRALSAASRALRGLSVVFDARTLQGGMTGTQLHVLEVIAAVARTGQARVTAVVPDSLGDYARQVLEALPEVELRTAGGDAAPVRGDVVHRPYQIANRPDLTFLAQLGDRLVITHQDMISFRNPTYFDSFGKWEGYRELTRRALAAADRVLFFSAHARDEALAEDLVEPHRASVLHIGVDHGLRQIEHEPTPPQGVDRITEQTEVMLCLGTDYHHKNRLFALRLLDDLRRRHGWLGLLVLAGPRVGHGSSILDEQRLLAADAGLRDAVINVGAVSEPEKLWLFRRAGVVLYPTIHEGFGLIPFEAADHGVPCLWAPGTALSEVLPDAAAGIVPWDAAAAAERALELLHDETARARNLEAIRSAAAGLAWDIVGHQLIEVYHACCNEPPTPSSARERAEGLMRSDLSDDAVRLIGPDGALSREMERPLLALATHPQIGAPVFGAIKAGYRASYRLRRLAGRPRNREPR